ncbi:hypothetical protein [Bdellovibrio sp. HCB337]|uniref:hypothetical protein n=1 Tax=Bdellovibrio sp. HCB337 TaxID=3394358 RepID=UPI0039A4AF69
MKTLILCLALLLSQAANAVSDDVFYKIAYPVGLNVDERYSSSRELIPRRSQSGSHSTDSCDESLDGRDRFAERIAYAVEVKSKRSRAQLEYVAPYYGLSKDIRTYTPNGFLSHPMCPVSKASLKTTLGSKYVPASKTVEKANVFVSRMNRYRSEAMAGNKDSLLQARKLWSKFMMCLAYTESLTSADSTKSSQVAKKYAPSSYRRPAGVKFYEDPYQSPESRLNIGLFQFTPNSAGNVQACIRGWNATFPACRVSESASSSTMIRILGSSLQTFNAFCAASKVTDMFAVQINTRNTVNTHPANVKTNGSLKAPADRCVSLHMSSGKSYNHFGPFQNTTGENLDDLLTCALSP